MTRRRQQILDVAAKLFAQRGFHGVSVADLGAACGMSGPALYKHFVSKEAILAEMLETVSTELLAGGRVKVAESASPADALRALVSFHTDLAVGRREVIAVQERDWSSLPQASRERVRALQREYVAVWAEQLRLRHPHLDQAEATARMHVTFGLLNSTPHSGRLPEEQMRGVLQEMAEAALAL